jgi:hypothetical protein
VGGSDSGEEQGEEEEEDATSQLQLLEEYGTALATLRLSVPRHLPAYERLLAHEKAEAARLGEWYLEVKRRVEVLKG